MNFSGGWMEYNVINHELHIRIVDLYDGGDGVLKNQQGEMAYLFGRPVGWGEDPLWPPRAFSGKNAYKVITDPILIRMVSKQLLHPKKRPNGMTILPSLNEEIIERIELLTGVRIDDRFDNFEFEVRFIKKGARFIVEPCSGLREVTEVYQN